MSNQELNRKIREKHKKILFIFVILKEYLYER